MKAFIKAFHELTKTYLGSIAFILIVFAFSRVVSLSVFYYGFLQTFDKAAGWLFKDTPGILAHVPFYSGSILFSSLLHPFFLITLLIFYVPFFVERKSVKEKLKLDPVNRTIIFVSAIILAWELCTYNFNFYLNHAFHLDRMVLILLAFSLLRFPVLTPLFIAFAFVYRAQFNFPVAGFELFDKRVLFDILVMYTVFMYAKLWIADLKTPFIFFAFCILASNYFMSGIEKIIMSPMGYNWLVDNDPADLFTNVHYRGWMAKSNESTIMSITNFLEQYGKLFQALVLLLELSALFLLRSRKIAVILLVSLSLMHLGIYAIGSMLFWKWMIIDILLAILIIKDGKIFDDHLFTKQNFKTSIPIILLSALWLRPIMIGWHDTPFNQFFTYEVEDKEGKVYELDKNEMDPYHQWFQFDHFTFLVNKPLLPISGFGYSGKYKVAAKVKEVGAEGFLELEEEKGKNNYDSIQKQKYDAFIRTFFKNRNEHLFKPFFWNKFSAPHHLHSEVKENEYMDKAPVAKFRVIFNQVYTKDHKPVVLNKQVVDEIVIY